MKHVHRRWLAVFCESRRVRGTRWHCQKNDRSVRSDTTNSRPAPPSLFPSFSFSLDSDDSFSKRYSIGSIGRSRSYYILSPTPRSIGLLGSKLLYMPRLVEGWEHFSNSPDECLACASNMYARRNPFVLRHHLGTLKYRVRDTRSWRGYPSHSPPHHTHRQPKVRPRLVVPMKTKPKTRRGEQRLSRATLEAPRLLILSEVRCQGQMHRLMDLDP